MIVQQTGKSKVTEDDSPQSHDSGGTDLPAESNSMFSTGSNELGATTTPTLEEQQEGMPEEIKSKTYPSDIAAAEDELFEDLKKHSLLDSDKVIVINQEGKAVWARPTVFHQDALQKLLRIINKHSDQEDPLLAQADIPLLIDKTKGKYRHPDVAIWGQSRLEAEDGEFDRKYIPIDGFPGENSMNAHAIIEFSWTNKIETEIWKLQEQVAGHIHALGVVRVGFLIKA